jgi:hypothetical protein
MPKICDMRGVREYDEGESRGAQPVELWRDDRTDRLVIRAYNEGGNNHVSVDLWDVIEWMQSGPQGANLRFASRGTPHGDDTSGD